MGVPGNLDVTPFTKDYQKSLLSKSLFCEVTAASEDDANQFSEGLEFACRRD